jgi:hypothetical protein
MTRGNFKMFMMFRVFRLLRKLPQTSLNLKHSCVSIIHALVLRQMALLDGKRFEVDGTGSFVRFVIMHQLSRVYQRVQD